MATLRYIGESGQVRRGDRLLEPGALVEVPEDEIAVHVASGLFEEMTSEEEET